MIFETSHDKLIQTFDEKQIHQVPARAAQAAGFSGETLTFLTDTGLPENQFISFPTFDGAGPGFRPVALEELGGTWNLPASATSWVFLGNFEISAIAADTQTGELYQFAEGIMRPIPLHGDLSSLVHTITELTKIVTGLPEDYDDDKDFLDSLGETLDALKGEIDRQDPRPFADEHSEWVEIVTNIGAGMWGQG
ncbi:SUKH-4 family immunity protein [Streptomyces sp. NPDC044984]|uniref:SUKH-4 family immunity protein n=1 Tax=Streptomyces sp. NPDC044984 TaxID=3154335 RepID=UPI0033D60A0F